MDRVFAFLKSTIFMAGLFFANGAIVIMVAEYSDGAATFWSANAVLAFALMIASRPQRKGYLVGAGVASLLLNLVAGHNLLQSIANSVGNLAEASFVASLLIIVNRNNSGCIRPRDLAYLSVISVLASAGSATISVMALEANHWHEWLSWFASDALGLLLVLPILCIVHQHFFGRKEPHRKPINAQDVILVSGTSSLVALGAFCLSTAPIIFICILPVVFSVFRLGSIGAIISTATIAIISITATLMGYGPIFAWSADQTHQILLLQGLLASLLMTGLPTAAVLAERDRVADDLFANEQRLRRHAEEGRRHSQLAARKATLIMAVDYLTGLASRQRILDKFTSSLHHSKNHKMPFSLAIFDVDRFKSINDRYGHAVGDEALKCIGDAATAYLPKGVRVGRIGGEEFLILFPGYEKQAALAVVEQFRSVLSRVSQSAVAGGFTISAGVAGYPEDGSSEKLLHAADAALYAAKRSGRNKTLLAA